MGNIFSYFLDRSHDDSLLLEIQRLRRQVQSDKLAKLLARMAEFSATHSSTTTSTNKAASDKKLRMELVSSDRLLSLAGLNLSPPLTRTQWREFRRKVDRVAFDGKVERTGVHPRIAEILKCCSVSNDLTVVYEGEFMDDECVIKRPDFGLCLNTPFTNQHISACLTNLEAKILGKIESGIQQSLGYTMSTLMNIVLLLNEEIFDTSISALCFASDGIGLAMGYIVLEKGELKIYSTGDLSTPLWGEIAGYEMEPTSLRVLRSVVGGFYPNLKITFPPRVIKGPSTTAISLLGVLGQGAFATVFHGYMGSTQCAVKVHRIDSACTKEEFGVQLVREESVLRGFEAQRSMHLPRLLFAGGSELEDPILVLRDVGVSLARHVNKRPKQERREIAGILHRELIAGLSAALGAGFCHADLRPDNVVFVESTGHFMIIDWSLSVKPLTLSHAHKGGKAFFSDALVLAADTDNWPITFDPQYDVESAFYICVAVVLGGRNLSVPWAKKGGGQAFIENRNNEVAKGQF